MDRMRSAPSPNRFAWAMLLSLVLAMRLVTPTGFMPAFERGRLNIVECPGSGPVPMAPMSGMKHDHGKTCETCPHATATGGGLIDVEPAALAIASFVSARLIGGDVVSRSHRAGAHERPPATGPPIIA